MATAIASTAVPVFESTKMCIPAFENEPGECTLPTEPPTLPPPLPDYLVYRKRGHGQEALAWMRHLRGWREAAGLTRWQLAVLTNIDPSTIRQLEDLKRPAHLGTVQRISDVLGLSNHVIIGHKPPEKLSDGHAFGYVVRIVEEGGTLTFRLTHLYSRLQRAGIDLAELAVRTGIAVEDLEEVYWNRMGVTVSELQRIAQALNTTLIELL